MFAFALADQDGNLLEEHSEVVIDDKRTAADAFLDYILSREKTWVSWAKRNVPAFRTPDAVRDFKNATKCHHCLEDFDKIPRKPGVPKKVFDHDHYNGKYIGKVFFCFFQFLDFFW